jgi:hypothetical protein
MCVFYMLWICCKGYYFFLMCIINWIKYTGDEWLVAIKALQEGKRKSKKVEIKGRRKWNDLICGQYTNPCKLGAN